MVEQIIVRQYGLLAPLDWDQDCQEHLWLQNKLWNRLVEIETEHQEKHRAVTSADESVATKEAVLAELLTHRADALKEKKKLRAEHRSKKIDTSLMDRQAKECAEQIKALRPELKILRAQSRERNKETLAALDTERKELLKQARNASGLWWGNYNAVIAAYDVARVQGLKGGRGLRFHRFDGTGRFTCQIQGGMPAQQLFGGKGIVAVAPLHDEAFSHPSRGERRRLQRTQLAFTLYTFLDEQGKRQRRTLSLPMVMHRPIPDGATIKTVTLKRDKVGAGYRWTVTFTCVIAGEPVQHPGSAVCGIDVGWRSIEKVGIRVATIADNIGRLNHVMLPLDLIEAFDWVDEIKSRLDKSLNEIHLWLKTRNEADLPEELRDDWAKIKKAPKIGAGRVAALSLRWRNHPDHHPELIAHLESWRKRDKRFSLEMDNLRHKTVARREDIYRNEALRIVTDYALVGLEDFDLRNVARLENAEGEDNILHQAARRMRQRVAVSEFRKWLILQAEKTGSEIFKVGGKTSLIHHRCGMEIKPMDKLSLNWRCGHCDEFIDQDENAAINIMLAAAGTPASEQVVLKTA